jgi:hypothetical protein
VVQVKAALTAPNRRTLAGLWPSFLIYIPGQRLIALRMQEYPGRTRNHAKKQNPGSGGEASGRGLEE